MFRWQLAAAGFEAALRLGRSGEAPELSPSAREHLRSLGHGAWMDQIEALGAGAGSGEKKGTYGRGAA